MKKIKLVLADGNRLSWKRQRSSKMDTAVVSGAAAVSMPAGCIDFQPDIAVVGEVLPDLSMVEAAKEIRRSVRNIRFVFIIRDGSADMLSLLAGMDSVGAVSQNCDISEFLTALRSVARGERYISAGVIEHLRSVSSDDCNGDDPLNGSHTGEKCFTGSPRTEQQGDLGKDVSLGRPSKTMSAAY